MKGKFDAYVLWPLNWIVDQSTACDFTVTTNYQSVRNMNVKVKTNFKSRGNKH